MTKVEHYESKRVDYMLPPDNDGLIDEFTIDPKIIPDDVVELKRSLAATLTAFWQADAAYMELKKRIE